MKPRLPRALRAAVTAAMSLFAVLSAGSASTAGAAETWSWDGYLSSSWKWKLNSSSTTAPAPDGVNLSIGYNVQSASNVIKIKPTTKQLGNGRIGTISVTNGAKAAFDFQNFNSSKSNREIYIDAITITQKSGTIYPAEKCSRLHLYDTEAPGASAADLYIQSGITVNSGCDFYIHSSSREASYNSLTCSFSNSANTQVQFRTHFADGAIISIKGDGADVGFQDGAQVDMGKNCTLQASGGTVDQLDYSYLRITNNANFSMGDSGTIDFSGTSYMQVSDGSSLSMGQDATVLLGAAEGASGRGNISVRSGSLFTMGENAKVKLGGPASGSLDIDHDSTVIMGAGSSIDVGQGGRVSVGNGSRLIFGDNSSLVLSEGSTLELNNTRAESILAGSKFHMSLQAGAKLTAIYDNSNLCTTERYWAMMDLNDGTLSVGNGEGDGKVEVYFSYTPLAEGNGILWIATGISNTVDTGKLEFSCYESVGLTADDMVFVQQGCDLFMVKKDQDTLYRTSGSGFWKDSGWSAYTGEDSSGYTEGKNICFAHVLGGEESITIDGNEYAASVFVSKLSDISLNGQGSLTTESLNVIDQSKLSIAPTLEAQTIKVSGASGLNLVQAESIGTMDLSGGSTASIDSAGSIDTLSLAGESRVDIQGATRIATLHVESGSELHLGSGATGFSITGQTGAQDLTWTGGAGFALLSAGDTPRATEGDLHLGTLSISADTAVHAGGSARTLHIGTMKYDADGAQAAASAPALYLDGAGLKAEDGDKIILDWGNSNPTSKDDKLWIAAGLPADTDILSHMAKDNYNFAGGSSWNNARLLLEHDNLFLVKTGTSELYWQGDANGNGTWNNSASNTPWITYTENEDGLADLVQKAYENKEDGMTVYFSDVYAANGSARATLTNAVKVDKIQMSKDSDVILDTNSSKGSLYAKEIDIDHSTLNLSGQQIILTEDTSTPIPAGTIVVNSLTSELGTLVLDGKSSFQISADLDLRNTTIKLTGDAGQQGAVIFLDEDACTLFEDECPSTSSKFECGDSDHNHYWITTDATTTIDFAGCNLGGYSGRLLQITEFTPTSRYCDNLSRGGYCTLDLMTVTGLENIQGWETSRLCHLIEGSWYEYGFQDNLYLIKSGKDDLYWTMDTDAMEDSAVWSSNTLDRWVLGYMGEEYQQATKGRTVHFSQSMMESAPSRYYEILKPIKITVTGTVETGDIFVESDYDIDGANRYNWRSLGLQLSGDGDSAIKADNLYVLGSILHTDTQELTIDGNVDLTGYAKWDITDRTVNIKGNVSGNGAFVMGINTNQLFYEEYEDEYLEYHKALEPANNQTVTAKTFTPDFTGLLFLHTGTLDLKGSGTIGDWNALPNPYQVCIGNDNVDTHSKLVFHHAQEIDLSEYAREMKDVKDGKREYGSTKFWQYHDNLGVTMDPYQVYPELTSSAGFVIGAGGTLCIDGSYVALPGATASPSLDWDYIDRNQALVTIKNSNVVLSLFETLLTLEDDSEMGWWSSGIDLGDNFKYRFTGPQGSVGRIPLIKIETTEEFAGEDFGFLAFDLWEETVKGIKDFINEAGQICKLTLVGDEDNEFELKPLTFNGPAELTFHGDNYLYYDDDEKLIYILGVPTEKRRPIWEGDADNKGYWTLQRKNYNPWHLNADRDFITEFYKGEDVWFNKCCGTDEKPAQAIIESVVTAGTVTLETEAVVEWQKSGEYADSILNAKAILFESGVKLTSTVNVTVEDSVSLGKDASWTIGTDTAEMPYITGATGSSVTIKEGADLHLTDPEKASIFHGLTNEGTIRMQDGGTLELVADSKSKFLVGDVVLENPGEKPVTITTSIDDAAILDPEDPEDPRVTVIIGKVEKDGQKPDVSLALLQTGGNGEVDYWLTANDSPIQGTILYGADTDTGSANVVLTAENVARSVILESVGYGNVEVDTPMANVIAFESAYGSAGGKVFGNGTPDGNNLLTITGDGKDHISGSMLGENLDIAYTGTGIQGFQGTDGFKGSITVDDKEEDGAAKLSIWGEQNKVDITNLTLGASDSLSLGTDSTATVSGVLTALGGPTEHRISDQSTASTVSGHLVLAEGSTLNVSQAMGTGGLNLDGHVLTLGTGSLLYDEDYRLITELTEGKVYDLAFHVQQLEIDNGGQILTFSEDIDASTVFSNITETGTYFIHYTGEANGGQGDNTGTVYIYKDDVIKLIWESSEVCGELSHAGIWDDGQQDNLAWHKNDKRQATYYFTNGDDVWFNKCCATENHPAISSILGTVIAGTVTLEESAIVNWVEAEGGSSLTARQLIVEHDVHLTSSVDVTVKDNTEGAPPTRVLLGERATWNIEKKTVTLDYITGAEGSGVTIGKTGTLALQERAAASLFHGLENDGTILMQAGGTIQLVADTKNTFKVGNVEIDNNAGADTTTITTATPGDAVTVVEVGSVVSLTQGSDNVKLALEQDGNGTVDYRLTENNAPIQGRIRYGAAPGSPTPDSSANVVLTGENVAAKAVLENTGRGNVVVVAESAKVMALESDQAFPAVSGGKVYGTPAESGSEQVNHRLEITGDGTHNYAGALGGNLDIAYTGTGTQAFGGADGFYGSITVNDGQNSTTADLEVLGQQSRMNITDLTIGSMDKLGMAEGGTAYVEQKLTALGGPTRDNVGTASTVSGNLVIMDNAMIDVSAAQGLGGLNLENHSLTISGNAYLSEADITYLMTMEIGAKYDLAYNVSELVLGGMKWEAGDPGEVTEQNDASRYFHLYPGEFYVCYLPGSAEDMIKGEVGNGHNVGTVCLVKAAPEPATATLSLLALAALAARRRRTR